MSTPPTSDQGWGKGPWGSSKWGSGDLGTLPPVITPISPLPDEVAVTPRSRPICISITDDNAVALVTLRIAVNGIIYVLGGVAQAGATLSTVPNAGNGFDVELQLPDPFPLESRQEVTVFVEDIFGNAADLTYFFSVGIAPRLLKVSNPAPGILVAHFNAAMLQNDVFRAPGNWVVTPVLETSPPITITGVFASPSQSNTAVLRHEGGGSTYELVVVPGIVSQDGSPLAVNSVLFEIVFGAEEDPTIRLFNTIFGPIGISQQLRLRRTIDDHVINRSIALGMDEQFRLRLQTLDATAGRNGRPGTRRT